jgi:hypothetical protein
VRQVRLLPVGDRIPRIESMIHKKNNKQ